MTRPLLAKLRDHLTYANVMATVAVFVALGGSSYAVSQISGKTIKNRSIPGKKLKRNAAGGKEVNEAKLGKVRSARSADAARSATTAGSADTLDGLDSTAFLRPSCPEGTLFQGGACIERSARPAKDFDAAAAECRGAQLRLPTDAELQEFRLLVPLAGEEWTSLQWDDNDGATFKQRALSVLPDGSTDGNTQGPGTTNAFRCVASWR